MSENGKLEIEYFNRTVVVINFKMVNRGITIFRLYVPLVSLNISVIHSSSMAKDHFACLCPLYFLPFTVCLENCRIH